MASGEIIICMLSIRINRLYPNGHDYYWISSKSICGIYLSTCSKDKSRKESLGKRAVARKMRVGFAYSTILTHFAPGFQYAF